METAGSLNLGSFFFFFFLGGGGVRELRGFRVEGWEFLRGGAGGLAAFRVCFRVVFVADFGAFRAWGV